MTDGDQLPTTPFGEVFDKSGAADPEQIGPTAAKSGTVSASTVTVRTCVGEVTHSVAAAVKV